MSAVYHGRQRPSHEGDDISALYMQAMNSLEDEELDPSRARAPQGAPATASRPDLTTPAGGYDNNNLGMRHIQNVSHEYDEPLNHLNSRLLRALWEKSTSFE
jgi:hypothetical protein